jgi:hypothetical protein
MFGNPKALVVEAAMKRRSSEVAKAASNGYIEQNRSTAQYIAMVVRNAMEDFHAKHLSDAQMRELNPIIRNAVYTALYAMGRIDDDLAAQRYVDFACRCIPRYWEAPELLEDYVRSEQR